MPGKRWAGKKRRAFLFSKLPGYLKAQKTDSTHEYVNEVLVDYFCIFSKDLLVDPTGNSLLRVGREKREEQIRFWFNNHSAKKRVEKETALTKVVFDPLTTDEDTSDPEARVARRKKKKRENKHRASKTEKILDRMDSRDIFQKLVHGTIQQNGKYSTPHNQVYLRIYYDDLEEELSRAYEEEKERCILNYVTPPTKLNFDNDRAKEMFENETDKVKAYVAKEALKKAGVIQKEENESAEDFELRKAEILLERKEEALRHIGDLVSDFIDVINEETGYVGVAYIAGEDPDSKGDLKCIHVEQAGPQRTKYKFSSFLQNNDIDLKKSFSEWAANCFDKKLSVQATAEPTTSQSLKITENATKPGVTNPVTTAEPGGSTTTTHRVKRYLRGVRPAFYTEETVVSNEDSSPKLRGDDHKGPISGSRSRVQDRSVILISSDEDTAIRREGDEETGEREERPAETGSKIAKASSSREGDAEAGERKERPAETGSKVVKASSSRKSSKHTPSAVIERNPSSKPTPSYGVKPLSNSPSPELDLHRTTSDKSGKTKKLNIMSTISQKVSIPVLSFNNSKPASSYADLKNSFSRRIHPQLPTARVLSDEAKMSYVDSPSSSKERQLVQRTGSKISDSRQDKSWESFVKPSTSFAGRNPDRQEDDIPEDSAMQLGSPDETSTPLHSNLKKNDVLNESLSTAKVERDGSSNSTAKTPLSTLDIMKNAGRQGEDEESTEEPISRAKGGSVHRHSSLTKASKTTMKSSDEYDKSVEVSAKAKSELLFVKRTTAVASGFEEDEEPVKARTNKAKDVSVRKLSSKVKGATKGLGTDESDESAEVNAKAKGKQVDRKSLQSKPTSIFKVMPGHDDNDNSPDNEDRQFEEKPVSRSQYRPAFPSVQSDTASGQSSDEDEESMDGTISKAKGLSTDRPFSTVVRTTVSAPNFEGTDEYTEVSAKVKGKQVERRESKPMSIFKASPGLDDDGDSSEDDDRQREEMPVSRYRPVSIFKTIREHSITPRRDGVRRLSSIDGSGLGSDKTTPRTAIISDIKPSVDTSPSTSVFQKAKRLSEVSTVSRAERSLSSGRTQGSFSATISETTNKPKISNPLATRGSLSAVASETSERFRSKATTATREHPNVSIPSTATSSARKTFPSNMPTPLVASSTATTESEAVKRSRTLEPEGDDESDSEEEEDNMGDRRKDRVMLDEESESGEHFEGKPSTSNTEKRTATYDEDERASRNEDTSTNTEDGEAEDDLSQYPKHFRAPLTFLRKVFGREYVETIDLWIDLERLLEFPDRGDKISYRGRPAVIGSWNKGNRSFKKLKEIEDLEVFARALYDWWVMLQPPWRLDRRIADDGTEEICLDAAKLPKKSERWESLAVGGRFGFQTILIGMAFWWMDERRAPEGENFFNIMEDIKRVLAWMTDALRRAQKGQKRKSVNEEAEVRGERKRLRK